MPSASPESEGNVEGVGTAPTPAASAEYKVGDFRLYKVEPVKVPVSWEWEKLPIPKLLPISAPTSCPHHTANPITATWGKARRLGSGQMPHHPWESENQEQRDRHE